MWYKYKTILIKQNLIVQLETGDDLIYYNYKNIYVYIHNKYTCGIQCVYSGMTYVKL